MELEIFCFTKLSNMYVLFEDNKTAFRVTITKYLFEINTYLCKYLGSVNMFFEISKGGATVFDMYF